MSAEDVRLAARGLLLAARAAPFDDDVRAGEIVGLAGLEGHGQEDFLEVLAGLRAPLAGEVRAGGAAIGGVAQAVRHGIAYLPRDRRTSSRNVLRSDLCKCRANVLLSRL